MGKVVRIPCARSPDSVIDGIREAEAAKPTSFFSGIMKWTYSTDTKGYRKVMICNVPLDCEGCPKKVRLAILRTEGVKQVKTDMADEIVIVMGKNMIMAELKRNIRTEAKMAKIRDIQPWNTKY